MNLLNCILYIIVTGVAIFFIGRIFPRKWIHEDKFPFKSFKWEKDGQIYNKIKVKKWKTRLPDASLIIGKFLPKFLPKKRIEGAKKEKISVLIKESCIAESTHFFSAITGLFCAKIWKFWGALFAFIWVLWNTLFIIIQRYNRPRLITAQNKFQSV